MREAKVTTLRIFKDQLQTIYDLEKKPLAKMQTALIGRNRSPHTPFFRIKDLHETQRIQLELQERNRIKKIGLPKKILDNLIDYFKKTPKINDEFDCGYFICHLLGVKFRKGIFNPENADWSFFLTDHFLKTGDTVLILYNDLFHIHSRHIAMYIGNGLYMSKIGMGRIHFSTLKEMKKIYGGNLAVKIKIKS